MFNKKIQSKSLASVKRELKQCANTKKAVILKRFFKTGPGEYGEGDRFIGVTMPQIRNLAKAFQELAVNDTLKLVQSPIHEERMLGLVIWCLQFKSACKMGDRENAQAIYRNYLASTGFINNWDLVDVTCREIVGRALREQWVRDPKRLKALAQSESLWERRIAMVSTWEWIRHGEVDIAFDFATLLKNDSHDLMHKAVGWMLREAGKKNVSQLKSYLDEHAPTLPRTTLRYSIERLSKTEKKHYMSLKKRIG